MMKFSNNYFILRHGEAISNKEQFVSSWPEKTYNPLTKKGIKQLKKIIPKIKKAKIDLIFSSDVLRTKLTAEMIAKTLGLKVKFDKRLIEIDTGKLNGKTVKEWHEYFGSRDRVKSRPPKGESWSDVMKRARNFLKDINKKYKDKKILIISHGDVLISIQGASKNLSTKKAFASIKELDNAELIKL